MIKDLENSSDELSPKVNALLIIDIQEKIVRPIFNKDSVIKNIKKLINAYQILEKNIFISEQNPLKLGETIPELVPKNGFKKIEKMEFSLANVTEFVKELNTGGFISVWLKKAAFGVFPKLGFNPNLVCIFVAELNILSYLSEIAV